VEEYHVLVVLAEERVRLPPCGAPPRRGREGVLRLRVLGHGRALPLHRALGRRLARQRRRAEPAAVPVLLILQQTRSSTSGIEQQLPGVRERAAVHEQLDIVAMTFGEALLRLVRMLLIGVTTSVFFLAPALLPLVCCNQVVVSSVR
jgi:hypothetical protein